MAEAKQETGCAKDKDFKELEKEITSDNAATIADLASELRFNPGKNRGDIDYGSAIAKAIRAAKDFSGALQQLARVNVELSETGCYAVTDMQLGINTLIRGVVDQNYLMEELKPGKAKGFNLNPKASNRKDQLSAQAKADSVLGGGPGDIDDASNPLVSVARRFYNFTERLSGITWSPEVVSDPKLRQAVTKRLDKSADGIQLLTSLMKDTVRAANEGDSEAAAQSIETLKNMLVTMDRDLRNFDKNLIGR